MSTTTTTEKWCEGVMQQQQQQEETISIGNIILNFFLDKKFKEIYILVDKLQYIDGNLQLDNDDNINVSLFWLAVLMNDVSLMSLLLKRGNCNVNALGTYKSRNFFKVTPLYVACASGYKYMNAIVILLKNKADVNITDIYGYTPFIKAIIGSGTKPTEAITIAKYLLLYNADINYTDIYGNTVLHYSITCSNNLYNLCARYLIRQGADPINIKSQTFSNLNAGMLYIIHLAQHDNIDDDLKFMYLMSFIDKSLVNSKYSTNKEIETMYRICGAAFNPSSSSDKFNEKKKCFWKKALECLKDDDDDEREGGGIYYKNFSNIVGIDKHEFRTIQDLEMINSKIDSLIQSIFISLRILGPRYWLTKNLLKQLLEILSEEDSSDITLQRAITIFSQLP